MAKVIPIGVVSHEVVVQDATVEALREWLAMAEAGEIVEVALVGFNAAGSVMSRLAGSNDKTRTLGALEILRHKMLTAWSRT